MAADVKIPERFVAEDVPDVIRGLAVESPGLKFRWARSNDVLVHLEVVGLRLAVGLVAPSVATDDWTARGALRGEVERAIKVRAVERYLCVDFGVQIEWLDG